jgi:lysophospholipase L1-like esterase
MNANKDKGISLLHNISLNDKDKLKWTGTFQALQMFVEEGLNISNGIWSSPGGDAKQFKAKDIDLRWYSDTQSITLNGKLKEAIKEQLISLASVSKRLSAVEESEAGNQDSYNENVSFEQSSESEKSSESHSLEKSSESHSKESKAGNQDSYNENVSFEQSSETEKSSESHSLEYLNNQLEALNKAVFTNTAAIKSLIENTNDSKQPNYQELENEIGILKEKNRKLTDKNANLKNENSDLEVRINNLTYILADLQGKVKSAEQEKESLITAMRLLVEDSNNEPNATIKNYTDETSKQSETQDSADCAGQTKEVLNPNIQVSNRFSNLNIEESNADDVDVTQNDLVTARTEPATKPKQVNEKYNRRHHTGSKETKQTYHHPRPNVAIVGDSMLKHINPTQLRRSTRSFNTQIKTFPGAKVSDMEYYVKPTLARTPDHLILHVGTNDVRQSTPQEITNAISMLGQQIKKELPTTNLAISEVITRNDDPSLNTKITELNTKLSQVCTNNKWKIITHRNISSEHLNPYGLHLSKQGTAKLAQNFTNYLKNPN